MLLAGLGCDVPRTGQVVVGLRLPAVACERGHWSAVSRGADEQPRKAHETSFADAGGRRWTHVECIPQCVEWLGTRGTKMLLGAPGLTTRSKDATRNKCIATSNKCLTSSNKKLLGAPGLTRSKDATRWRPSLVGWRHQDPYHLLLNQVTNSAASGL